MYVNPTGKTWVVEVTNKSGKCVFYESFNDYAAAESVYHQKMSESDTNNVSLTATNKKLLVE